MDQESMSHEENYCFDVGGYLVVRGVLGRGEVAALNSAIDTSGRNEGMLGWPHPLREPFRDLLVHPHLVWYLNQIVGQGFRLETEPELLCDDTCETEAPLQGGNEPRDPTRAYYYQNGRRFSETVRAVWALADAEAGAGGFVMVPCSHKSNVETPDDVLTGDDDMGLTLQPALEGGRPASGRRRPASGHAAVERKRTPAPAILRVRGPGRHPLCGDRSENQRSPHA